MTYLHEDYELETIKNQLQDETGLKVTMKKENVRSSLRGYITFTAKKVGGVFPEWTFDFSKKMISRYPGTEENPTFCNRYRFSIYLGNEAYNV